MGCARVMLGLVVLFWSAHLPLVVMAAMEKHLERESGVRCGAAEVRVILPSGVDELGILDLNGKSHNLQNDSDCGTWVGMASNGSVAVGVAYDGCFVTEEEGYFVATIVYQEVDGKRHHYHKKDVKCPILALDAPSDGDCAAIDKADRILCGNSSLSRELCEGIDCCYNPSDQVIPCYYGHKITAHCNDEGHVVVVLSKDLTSPPLILTLAKATSVDEASCSGFSVKTTSTFVAFRFPLSCSSVIRGSDGRLVYENTFLAEKGKLTWGGSSITRDSTLRVTVSCTFAQTGIVPVQVEVNTLPPPPPVSTSGPLLLEMRIAQGEEYAAYYADKDYPVIKVLRDPVFLEVRILQRTDPNLVLVLNNCWATASVNPKDDQQWPVLFNGCPFTGDNYLTQLAQVSSPSIQFPSHYQRFVVSTFTFVDTNVDLDGLVFFHCSASVCVPSASQTCKVDCKARKRRMADSVVPEESVTVTSDGPVIFNNEGMIGLIMEEEDLSLASSRSWLLGAAGVGCVLIVLMITVNMFKRQRPNPQ